jgi:hypothetical protein
MWNGREFLRPRNSHPVKAVIISTQNLRLKKDNSGKQAASKVALTQSIGGFFGVFTTRLGKSIPLWL